MSNAPSAVHGQGTERDGQRARPLHLERDGVAHLDGVQDLVALGAQHALASLRALEQRREVAARAVRHEAVRELLLEYVGCEERRQRVARGAGLDGAEVPLHCVEVRG